MFCDVGIITVTLFSMSPAFPTDKVEETSIFRYVCVQHCSGGDDSVTVMTKNFDRLDILIFLAYNSRWAVHFRLRGQITIGCRGEGSLSHLIEEGIRSFNSARGGFPLDQSAATDSVTLGRGC
jgi:hypothetical protein